MLKSSEISRARTSDTLEKGMRLGIQECSSQNLTSAKMV